MPLSFYCVVLCSLTGICPGESPSKGCTTQKVAPSMASIDLWFFTWFLGDRVMGAFLPSVPAFLRVHAYSNLAFQQLLHSETVSGCCSLQY